MENENRFLMYAMIMGIFITFVYDILRIFRRVVPHGIFLISIEDFCFWVYCAVEVFLLMYHESNGTMRWFGILGAFFGMFCYKKWFSPFFVKYFSFFFLQVKKIILKIIGIFWKPFGYFLDKIKKKKQQFVIKKKKQKEIKKQKWKKKLKFFWKLLKM